jgi:hypothetical protein
MTLVTAMVEEEALNLSAEDGQLSSTLVRESQEGTQPVEPAPVAAVMAFGSHTQEMLVMANTELPREIANEDRSAGDRQQLNQDQSAIEIPSRANGDGLQGFLADCFGPHSPTGPCSPDGLLNPSPATTTASTKARPGLLDILDNPSPSPHRVQGTVAAFVNGLTMPIQPPLLPPSPTNSMSKACAPTLPAEAVVRSSRLAVKPTTGLSSMDKVKIVLLKKNGIELKDENPQDALKKYNAIY